MPVISVCLAAWIGLLGAMQDPWEPSGACSSGAKDRDRKASEQPLINPQLGIKGTP